MAKDRKKIVKHSGSKGALVAYHGITPADIFKSCKFSFWQEANGDWKIRGTCPLKDSTGKTRMAEGELNLTPLVKEIAHNLRAAQKHIAAELTQVNGSTALEGWLADTYHKAVEIAKKVGQNKITKDIYEDVLPQVAPYVPGGTVALGIVDKAHDVWEKARAGVPAAREKMHEVIDRAKQGSDKAKQVVSLWSAFKKAAAQKAAYERYDEDGSWVNGYLYNRPYRDNVTAKELDKSNPFHMMRWLYSQGARD